MGLFSSLEKLTITREGAPGEFKVLFNPEGYKESYKNNYGRLQGLHTPDRPAEFAYAAPPELTLKLIFDGTGVYDTGATKLRNEIFKPSRYQVKKQIEDFLKLTTFIDFNKHEPSLVELSWGDLQFSGRLTKLDIQHKLFSKSGESIRAEVTATFCEDQTEKDRKGTKKNKSPDVSHRLLIKAGDTLPQLCQTVYGNSRYYLQVAAANKLNDFRNLQPGQEIWFPPLKRAT